MTVGRTRTSVPVATNLFTVQASPPAPLGTDVIDCMFQTIQWSRPEGFSSLAHDGIMNNKGSSAVTSFMLNNTLWLSPLFLHPLAHRNQKQLLPLHTPQLHTQRRCAETVHAVKSRWHDDFCLHLTQSFEFELFEWRAMNAFSFIYEARVV